MNYLSMCSGIEAATVAWHGLGNPIAFSEIEPFPSAVLSHHYPEVPNLGDMTQFKDWPHELLAQVDIVVGGPPCQAFSVAGLRNSLDDERGNLTLVYVHLIDHIDKIRKEYGRNPVTALYENVPGLLSTKDNAFGCLVGSLCGQNETLETESGKWPNAGLLWGEKRRVGWRVLDAQYFGVAQRRRRVFVVAVHNETVERLGGGACPSEILAIPDSLRGDTPPRRSEGEEIAGTLKSRARSGGWSNDLDMAAGGYMQVVGALCHRDCRGVGNQCVNEGKVIVARRVSHSEYREGDTADPVYALAGNVIGRNPDLLVGGNGPGFDDTGICYTLTKTDVHAIAFEPGIARRLGGDSRFTEELSPTLRVNAGDNQVAVACHFDSLSSNSMKSANPRSGCNLVETAKTLDTRGLTTSCNQGGMAVAFAQNTRDEVRYVGGDGQLTGALSAQQGTKQTTYLNIPPTVRRLTPVECARLQGFPDDYLAIPFRGKPASDTAKYKALGNSMAVPVMRWLGQQLATALLGDAGDLI